MAGSITIDAATGAAVLRAATAVTPGQALKFSLQNTSTRQYLTPGGWVSARKTLAEVIPEGTGAEIVLDAATAALVAPGTPLMLEEIFVNLREPLTWPAPAVQPTVAPAPPDAVPTPPQAAPIVDTSVKTARAPIAAGLVGLLAGAVLTYAGSQLAPTAPAGELVAREDALASAEQDLARRSSELDIREQQLAAKPVPVTSGTPQTDTGVAELQTRFDGLRVDYSIAEARVAEQEKLIARLRDEAGSARASAADATSAEGSDLTSLRQEVERLQKKNRSLEETTQAQTRTISEWAGDRTAATQKIRALEQEVALAKVRAPSGRPDLAIWVSAAVDAKGAAATGVNQVTKAAAETVALTQCGGAAKGCRIIDTYRNACFALSRPTGQKAQPGNWRFSFAASWQVAEQQAVSACEEDSGLACNVRISVCSPAHLGKPE